MTVPLRWPLVALGCADDLPVVDRAMALADERSCRMTLVHPVDRRIAAVAAGLMADFSLAELVDDAVRKGEALLRAAAGRVPEHVPIDTRLVYADRGRYERVLDVANARARHDALVLGPSLSRPARRHVRGAVSGSQKIFSFNIDIFR